LTPLQLPKDVEPLNAVLAAVVPLTHAGIAAWQARLRSSPSAPPCAAGWLTLPWLPVECYLYVRLATLIAQQVRLIAPSGN
jgi:hypothetical protein